MAKSPLIVVCALVFAGSALAKLPPLTPEQQAAADVARAKAAYEGKLAAYQLCQVESRVADIYLRQQSAKGKSYTPDPTPPCESPGAAPAAAPAPK